MPNRLGFGVLQRFAELQAVRDLRAGGMKRLERRFRFSGSRANAQREARTMNPPVIRVQVGIEYLQGGAWFEHQSADGAVVGQPAANGAKIGAGKLPLHFTLVLVVRLYWYRGG